MLVDGDGGRDGGGWIEANARAEAMKRKEEMAVAGRETGMFLERGVGTVEGLLRQ